MNRGAAALSTIALGRPSDRRRRRRRCVNSAAAWPRLRGGLRCLKPPVSVGSHQCILCPGAGVAIPGLSPGGQRQLRALRDRARRPGLGTDVRCLNSVTLIGVPDVASSLTASWPGTTGRLTARMPAAS